MPTADFLYEMILQKRPAHRPWSLAEAGTAGYFGDLKQWAEGLEVHAFDALAHQQPLKTGILLLSLHSELIRRHGHERHLWAVLSDREIMCWRRQIWERLYQSNGNLQNSHGQLLEKAARWLGLRQPFDDEEPLKKWYRLIHLQFGFTHEDAKSRLKDWLSGQMPPVAVQTLLEERDLGAMKFQRMWHCLRQFRLGNVSREGMKVHLKSCCWVLPEWTEDLLKAALAADAMPFADEEDESVSQFYTSPVLRWDGSVLPSFSVELCHLSEIEAKDDLEVQVQGRVLARLLKQQEGGYVSDIDEGALVLGVGSAARSRVDMRLVSADKTLVRQATISLWDADAEISLYRPSDGLIVVESQLRAGQAFDLIATGDLKLMPTPESSTPIGAGYQLHRFEKGWAGVIEARMDNVAIWTSAGFGKQPEPLPLDVIRGRWKQILDFTGAASHVWPWKVPLKLEVLDQKWTYVGLRWTRADGKLMSFSTPPSELSLVEGDIARPLTLRVTLRHATGRVATVPVNLPPPMQGCVRWSPEGRPVIQRGDKSLLISDASRAMWSFLLPERRDDLGNLISMEDRRCSFMEGDVVRGSVRSRAIILPRLGGYGAPVWISDDPYNGCQHSMEVASRAIDGGVIGNVRVDGDANKVTVTRVGHFDLTERHDMLAWIALADKSGGVVRVTGEFLRSIDSGWEFSFPRGGSLLGVGLFYEGVRLGSWFSATRWSNVLMNYPPAEPTIMAGMLRAWKAPMLQSLGSEDHRSQVVAWLREHWMTALPVWMASKGDFSSPGMVQTPVPPFDSEWKHVVLALVSDLNPKVNAEQVETFVNKMNASTSNQSADDRLGFCLVELAEVCPLLAARTLVAVLQSPLICKLKAGGKSVVAQMRGFFPCREETAMELAIRHGNRDSHWLRLSIPSIQSLESSSRPLSMSFLRLCGSDEFRKFAFGVWVEEIRQQFHL